MRHCSARTRLYASTSRRASSSDASAIRMRTSQPSPYGSSFTVSGASTTFWFTSSTSPDNGAIRSETALTDSASPYGLSFVTVPPALGGSKWTSSPSASAANHVMPTTASSPSIRAQSCASWYFRSSGYDSAAANSALPLVDRSLHDLRGARLSAHVDRQLRPECGLHRRHVPHPDADVEARRVRSGGDLAAALDRHALARDRALRHHERHELARRPLLLHAADDVDAGELLAERARPAGRGGDRVGV